MTPADKIREFYQKHRENIERGGQSLMGVFGGDGPPFTYTIGNHGRSLPEFLLVGLRHETAGVMLNDLGQKQRAAGLPLLGEWSFGGKFPVRLVDVTCEMVKRDYTIQVGRYYNDENYRVTQIVWPDKQGRYPKPLNGYLSDEEEALRAAWHRGIKEGKV
jgi:hypothetical protein